MSEIAGKNIVISGGARGIGRLMAVKMARLGGRVILYDLDATALEAVVDEISAASREAYSYVCDVSDRREVYRVADEIKTKVGLVDILINNAGIVTGKRLLEIPDESIEAVIGVNILALYWLTNSFLPEMIERDSGHVVTIASAAGLLGVNRQTDYSASKHAAIGLTEALRVELKRAGRSGVKTIIVEPFYVDTQMMEGVKSRFPRLLPILLPVVADCHPEAGGVPNPRSVTRPQEISPTPRRPRMPPTGACPRTAHRDVYARSPPAEREAVACLR